MAFHVSPGIQVREYDFSTYIPGVATSEAAIGGVFSWGPSNTRELIGTEDELVARFGRPNDDNYETFMIAANFLAYSNALYVSRAVDANTVNAQAFTGMAPSTIQIKNDAEYTTAEPNIPAVTNFVAKYPGALGNSLKISVCASADAYSSTIIAEQFTTLAFEIDPYSNVGTITVVDTATNDVQVAEAGVQAIYDQMTVGEYVAVPTNNGLSMLKIKRFGTIEPGNSNEAIGTLVFENTYAGGTTHSDNTISRMWEFYNLVSRAPGTSTYTDNRGGEGDEIHVVVTDKNGKITGVPNTILEVWESLSRATDGRSESGTNSFYRTVLNESSLFVWVGSPIAGVTEDVASALTAITVPAYTNTFTLGADGATESTIDLASLTDAYDQFKSQEALPDLGMIIAGKAMGGINGEALANYIIDNVAELRKDVMVLVSPPASAVVNAPYAEDTNIIAFADSVRFNSRVIITTAYKYQYDKYSNKSRWVAGCGDDAGLLARTDYERDPWWSPAGQSRGQYKNIIKLAYNPDKNSRDVLYRAGVNPVVTKAGSGTYLYGDKTHLGKASAFDRINVRRLFDVLEKAIARASADLLFEFNNVQTRARFRNMVEPFLRDVMGRQGITRFRVICDESNNTAAVIDRNEFVGSIMVVPAKSINFITLNFYAVGNAVEFDYVIGQI